MTAKTAEQTKAMAVVEENTFLALNPEIVNESGAIQAAVDVMETMPNILKLDSIKCPAGGAIAWKLQGFDGPYSVEKFEAIIIGIIAGRKYWQQEYSNGRGTPPDCLSSDTLYGIGNPGGRCAKCPMNEFDDTTGTKPCREFRTLILLMPDTVMPVTLTVPVTSIENLSKYMQRLASGGKKKDGTVVMPKSYFAVTTSFGLVEDHGKKSGKEYSKMTFEMSAELSRDQIKMVKDIKTIYDPIIKTLNEKNGAGSPDDGDPADDDE